MIKSIRASIIIVSVVAAGLSAAPIARLVIPQQPWASVDGDVHLLRPILAAPTTSGVALGSLMSSGWHLVWDGSPLTPGSVVVRLALKAIPKPPQTAVSEVLQIGVSRDPVSVKSCLIAGLKSGSAQHLPDRTINRQRFTVYRNADAGMSQGILATDLRTVVQHACYAVDRFTYTVSASDPDPTITLSQQEAISQLDGALASIQLGQTSPDQVLRPSTVRAPWGTRVR